MPIFLVVGGSGSLGSELVERLSKKEEVQVVVFDKIRPSYDLNEKIRFIEGDILVKEQVARALEGVEVVFHLAALVKLLPIACWEPFYQINVVGTQNIVDCCLASDTVQKLIFTSSYSVIIDKDKEFCGEEDAPSTEASQHDMAYSATKAISERIVLAANRANGRLLTCAIRPGFIFGEKDKWLIKEIKQVALQVGLKKLPQWKDKKVSFVHMENVIDALLLAEEKLVEDSHVAGQSYFITNNEPQNFLDVICRIGQGIGYPVVEGANIPHWLFSTYCTLGEWAYDLKGYLFGFSMESPLLIRASILILTRNFYVSSTKAERELGYKPKVSMEEGIQRTIEAFRPSQ